MNLKPDPALSKNGHPPVSSPSAAGATDVKNPKKSNPRPQGPKKPPLHQIYTLPAPVRTFPLPTFFPSNPLSLFHVLYAWISQAISPPPREPALVHKGIWSPETRSVHIVDQQSIRALWEQGFFGKGIYSRSEPNWLRREQSRRGEHAGHVAENFTAQRRKERNQMKWERARKEQEAIQRTRMREAWVAPVGPLELLALPNSALDLELPGASDLSHVGMGADQSESPKQEPQLNGGASRPQTPAAPMYGTASETPSRNGSALSPRRQKSVRFSPRVEATTFNFSDPPSPGAVVGHANGKASTAEYQHQEVNGGILSATTTPGHAAVEHGDSAARTKIAPAAQVDEIKDIEHLQLAPEEAFYLSFVLGVLTIVDPKTGAPLPVKQQLLMFCRSSHPRPSLSSLSSGSSQVPSSPCPAQLDTLVHTLEPDEPFLLHYATYHHFRSLGWVVRPGIKFGVDWLLYHRGPVFSHAEFAVLVLPAYTHRWWKTEAGRDRKQSPRRSWHWLHCANRVQAKALKTLVLVYVDVSPPLGVSDLDEDGGDYAGDNEHRGSSVAALLGRYKMREFMVKRWLSNRNRD